MLCPRQLVLVDGVYYAKINSRANSVYTLIWQSVEFNDVAGHWAEDAINDMGARMIISGVGDNKFDPDREITRAALLRCKKM